MFGVSNWLIAFSLGVAWLGYGVLRLWQVRSLYKDKPKAPGHSFLWGHLKLMAEVAATMPPNCHPQYYITAIAQKYNLPGAWYLDLWPITCPQLIVTDPDASMQLLTVSPTLKHDMVGQFMEPVLGKDTIVAVNGEPWKLAHRLLGSGFSPSYVKPMLGMFAEHVLVFHRRLRALAEKGRPVKLEKETAKAVFDVIGVIVFGFSLDAQGKGSQLLDDLRYTVEHLNFVLTSWNPVTKALKSVKLRAVKGRSSKTLEKAILERYEIMKDEKELPTRRQAKSIMDRIIADYIQSGNTGPPRGQFLEAVVINLKTLILGGHGTITDTFTFLTMLLSLYPDVMQRVREEHDAVFPADVLECAETLRTHPQKTNELEYTTAVIKETLRLFPVGFTARKAQPGQEFLEWDGRQLPLRDHMLSISNFTTHFDPSIWGDPKVFRPERFLGEEGAAQHRFAWRPFERGPRACMGQDLAMDEMRVLLLLTARWFDYETIPENVSKVPRTNFTDLDLQVGDWAFQEMKLGAAPRTGMRLRVKPSGRPGGLTASPVNP
ncbi:cytochrome p450 monooxygenase [Colletotrichum sojae]|uniref:Cytochrome p450 monooxygenase n=1 Tax=Colletotrichum sojae TaxID=2175907 RepID=A0A8H6MK03_9PEZI|nr:cytochrome p450 monooxygenase [Colletotrichum sojae]